MTRTRMIMVSPDLNRSWWLCFLIIMMVTGVATTTPRPHIIVIVADDLGWNDVSFHGSNQIPTPHIDSLAYSGIILNNYYVAPLCTPTRGALLSGLHPIHTGLQQNVIDGSEPFGLPLNITIMPQWLKKLGYRTHMVGKWHLGFFKSEYTPTYRGFESFTGMYLGLGDYYDHTSESVTSESYFGYDFRRNTSLDYSAIGQYSTSLFTDRAVDIINQHNAQEPLFLYLPYQAVHSGNVPSGKLLQAPSSYVNRHPHIHDTQRKNFAGIVAAMDDGVATVVNALKTRDLYKNSVILFTTDNGGAVGGAVGGDIGGGNNFPLRGMKQTLWEGGIRGTGFIHSPLLQQSEYVSDKLMDVCDWLPTLYSVAGGNPDDIHGIDGYDMWNMLSSNGNEVRHELLHNMDGSGKTGSIRVGDYKLLVLHAIDMNFPGWYPPPGVPQTMIQSSKSGIHDTFAESHSMPASLFRRSKQTPVKVECGQKQDDASFKCNKDKPICLFHIPSDPCEYNNIADANTDKVGVLLNRLELYAESMVPPLKCPMDPLGNPKLHNGAWEPWLD